MSERERGTTTHYRAKSGERAWFYLVAIGITVLGFAAVASDGFGILDSPDKDGDVAVLETPEPSETFVPTREPTPEPTPTASPRATSAPVPTPVLEPDVNTIAAEANCDISQISVLVDPALREWSNYWYSVASGTDRGTRFVAGYPGQNTPVWYAGTGSQMIAVAPVPENPELSARNLDDGSTVESVDLSVPGNTPGDPLAVGIVGFPTPGCWELAVGDDRIVVFVLPGIDNPEVERVANERAELLPTDPTPACEATGWGDPSIKWGLPAGYWIDGAGLSAWHRYGVLFEGENLLFLVPDRFPEGRATARIEGVHKEMPDLTAGASVQQRVGGVASRYWSVDINFPASGCWDLIAHAGEYELTATVYVYPGEGT